MCLRASVHPGARQYFVSGSSRWRANASSSCHEKRSACSFLPWSAAVAGFVTGLSDKEQLAQTLNETRKVTRKGFGWLPDVLGCTAVLVHTCHVLLPVLDPRVFVWRTNGRHGTVVQDAGVSWTSRTRCPHPNPRQWVPGTTAASVSIDLQQQGFTRVYSTSVSWGVTRLAAVHEARSKMLLKTRCQVGSDACSSIENVSKNLTVPGWQRCRKLDRK